VRGHHRAHPYGAKQVTEVQLFKNIVGGNFTARHSGAQLPEELERIVLWAIEPDVNKRCPTPRPSRRPGEVRGFGSLRLHHPRGAGWIGEHVPRKFYSVPVPSDHSAASPRSPGGRAYALVLARRLQPAGDAGAVLGDSPGGSVPSGGSLPAPARAVA
jgi:hypothetical protein